MATDKATDFLPADVQSVDLPQLPQQAELFPNAELDAANEQALQQVEHQQGLYSGARIQLQRPEVYNQCLVCLAADMQIAVIARVCGLSRNAVYGIAKHARLPIDHIRNGLAADSYQLSTGATQELLQRIAADPSQFSASELIKVAEHAAKAGQLLSGGATSRSESGEADKAGQSTEWAAWLADQDAAPVVDVPADEVDSSKMGFGTGESGGNISVGDGCSDE